jgi:glutaredoxin
VKGHVRLFLAVSCAVLTAAPLLVGLGGLGGLEGCKRHADVAADDAAAVPPFSVTEKSEGLLLTWIDEKGDFHVEQKVSDVPLVGRDAVRVLDPAREEGTHDGKVFVADLRTARPDGTFAVRAMTRAEFEALAVERRAKNAPTLASAGPAGQGAPSHDPAEPRDEPRAGGQGSSGGSDTTPTARPAVIIYGASWCGACHDAAAYLKRKGIPFIEKDIEADAKAAQEMRGKLARAGLRGGSIPVLDVRGHVMVGFNPREVESALGQAL